MSVSTDSGRSSGSSVSSSGLSLARRLRDGSDGAWGEMVRLYGPLLDHWCRTGGIPSAALADVAQEICVSAFRSLKSFDADQTNATFRGWLWTIARNRIVDYHRRQKRVTDAVGGSTAYQALQELIDPAALDLVPVDDPTEADHLSALIHRALNQIRIEFEETTWESFWRATVLGHPTDLIASENGVTPAAVRQSKSRVLRRLRKQLGDK